MDENIIEYDNKKYGIIIVKYKNKDTPVVLDYNDYNYIKNLNKQWYINENGFVSCYHNQDNNKFEINMHTVIMALKNKDLGLKREKKPIVHLNRLGLDNRRENLMYDVKNSEIQKNYRKKKRIIELPINSGINIDNIPTYVWYMKPDKSHDERFLIKIGEFAWKTSSKKYLSLKYKLEEAKKLLRKFKEIKPDYFNEFSMNGDLNNIGKKQFDIFNNIIKKAGFNINNITNNNNTEFYLKENKKYLNKNEKILLDNFDPSNIINKIN